MYYFFMKTLTFTPRAFVAVLAATSVYNNRYVGYIMTVAYFV